MARDTLGRLFRLWQLYATMDLLYLLRGPDVAVAYYVSDLIIGLGAFTATFLLAARFDGIGPWTRPQVLFLIGYGLLVRALVNTLFNYNLAQISRRIGRGQLDHILVQPQPMWMALLTEGFAPVSGSGMFAPAAVLLVLAARELQLPLSPMWIAFLCLNLVASIAIVLAFEYAWGTIAFWAPRSAEEINSSTWQLLMQLSPFPLDGLSTALITTLVTVIPVGLVAWLPARALLGIDAPGWSVLLAPAAALVLGGVTVWFFHLGMRQYGRTGSSRYLAYGHRQ